MNHDKFHNHRHNLYHLLHALVKIRDELSQRYNHADDEEADYLLDQIDDLTQEIHDLTQELHHLYRLEIAHEEDNNP